MREEDKKKLEQEERELAELAKEEEKWKQQRIKDGNLFTGYDKVNTKSKMELLLKMWHSTKDHDSKLIIDDLMRDVERTKLGLTLNYHYVDEKLDKSDTVFVEQKGLSLKPKEKEQNHLIIEGDNMHSLTALKNTKQEVDVIYIDPPYNTGKEFAYNDKLVSGDDQQKHSKWLSFMKQRLELAKDIMSEDGVIFVSIDDNEQAYLKVLMDEIFGEENFSGNFIWRSTTGANDTKTISKTHEYVLCYSKLKNFKGILTEKNNLKRDDFFDTRGGYELKDIHHPQRTWIKSLDYPIYITRDKKISLEPPKEPYKVMYAGSNSKSLTDRKKDWERRNKHGKANQLDWRWTWSKDALRKGIELNCLKIEGEWDLDNLKIHKKKYERWNYIANYRKGIFLKDDEINRSTIKSIIDEKSISTSAGGIEIKKIFGKKIFSYPKPSKLIKKLVGRHPNKNATVLDFFAGSGTTGQAVMELNQEDGGNRRFILCTNNERTGYDTIKNPEKGIAQAICRERIYRVINGVGSKGEKIDWTYSDDLKSLKNNTVTYLKTECVNKRRQLEEEKGTHLNSTLFYSREQRNLYRKEFDTDSTEVPTDFKKRKTIKKNSFGR